MAAALAVLTSCDNVDEGERFIYVKPADVQRCVLIEDFTGQNCPNCPNAAQALEALHEEYSDNVIAVAIHGGRLAYTPLKSPVGDEYYTAAGSPNLPAGRIDRIGGTSVYAQWAGAVSNAISRKATVSFNIGSDYDAAAGTAAVSVDVLGLEAVSGKLQIWLVEDGIVAWQAQPDGSVNPEYVHNHVLRAAVNGTWGEDITLGEGETVTVNCTAPIDGTWNAANMSVVAFVYNDGGVQNVAKAPLVTPTAE